MVVVQNSVIFMPAQGASLPASALKESLAEGAFHFIYPRVALCEERLNDPLLDDACPAVSLLAREWKTHSAQPRR